MSDDITYGQEALSGTICAAALVLVKPTITALAVGAGLLVVATVKSLEPS